MPAEKTAKNSAAVWIVVNLCLVLAGLGFVGKYFVQRHQEEKARHRRLLPKMPKEQEQKIREAVRQMGRIFLKVTPDQEKRIEAIWVKMPETLDEVVELNKKTDAILTPEQRAMVLPIRRMIRDGAVDRVLEPARERLPPADFEQFKNKIKARVAQRVER